MAVTNGWGQGVINNTNGFGKLATNNIGAGSVYENSASGDTVLVAPSAPSFASTQSFNFDGVDDFMELSSAISITNEFSLSFWIKPDGFGSSSFVLTDNPSATFLRLSSASLIQFKISGTLLQFSDSGNNLVDGVWQHLFIYRDSSNSIKILRNGTSFASSINNSNTLVIGTIAKVLSFFFTGSLDEISFFNTDQSANISSIYNSGVPNDISSLNPVAWYRMGENSNYKSPQWLMKENSNKDKFSNYSYEFDGVDNYIISDLNATSSSSIFPSTYSDINFTISCWFKVNSVQNNQGVFQWANSLTDGTPFIVLNIRPSGNAVRVYYDSGFRGSGSITVGQWHSFIMTRSSTDNTARGYIDGVEFFSHDDGGSISSSQRNSATNIYLGNGFNGYAECSIDEFSVFDSVQNIATLYNSGTPTTLPSGAVAHYKLGEEATFSTNWTIPDQVGSNDGTSTNMTIEDRIGDSPNSTNNAVSFNMVEADRETDVPT